MPSRDVVLIFERSYPRRLAAFLVGLLLPRSQNRTPDADPKPDGDASPSMVEGRGLIVIRDPQALRRQP